MLFVQQKLRAASMLALEPLLQEFFLEAVRKHGWAAGREGDPVPGSPGFNRIAYGEAKGFLFEEYHGVIAPSSRRPTFSDTIFLSYEGVRLWRMLRSGQFDPKTKAFYQEALMENYREGLFIGGGSDAPFEHKDHPEYLYENKLSFGDFSGFQGSEIVREHHPADGEKTVRVYDHLTYVGGILGRDTCPTR